jgi:4-amino-4-deoxy-L-arabinose transferase-like glycosyltransferase
MFRRLNHRMGHYLLLIAVWAVLTLPNLGAATLWDIDEGNNAEAAREMLASDNWTIPTFNFALRVDKPVLLYWLQIACYKTIGINEFAARLPSALAALLGLLATYELGRRMFNRDVGLLAGVVLATAPAFGAAAHFANPDALLTAFTTLAFLSFWHGHEHGGRGWFVPPGIFTGLAVLAKGPVGLLLPLGVVFLFLLWSRQLGRLWDRRLGWGIAAFLLVAAPWYAWVGIDTKGVFLKGFLLTHNLSRFQSAMEGHRGPVVYFLGVLPLGFLLWSAFFVPTLANSLKKFPDEKKDSGALRLLACWIGVYLIFFSLSSTKLPNYILPLYPAMAILLARYLDGWRRGVIESPAWITRLSLASFGLIGLAVGVGLLLAGGKLGGAEWLRGRHLPGLEYWAWTGLLPALGSVAAWICIRRGQIGAGVGVLAGSAVLFLGLLAAEGTKALDAYKAPAALAEAIEAQKSEPEIRMASYDYFQPSLVFYNRREVTRLQTEQEAQAFLRSPLPVYLFVPASTWEELRPRISTPTRSIGRRRDLYRNCDVVVITNRQPTDPR